MTGTVKFFIRSKAYGFITPDDPNEGEIWVHRTSFNNSIPVDEFLTRPYLLKGERVKYQVAPNEAGNEANPLMAKNVTYETGALVPPFRKGYVANLLKYEHQVLGAKVHDILKDDKSTNEDKLQKIMEANNAIVDALATAKANMEKYNPPDANNVDNDAESQ